MNHEIFEGKWKEFKGQIKEKWGILTDDDLDRANGKAEQIVGLLEQKVGYTKEHAEKEFNGFLEKIKVH